MKCQTLFFWENKKNVITSPSANLAQSVLKGEGSDPIQGEGEQINRNLYLQIFLRSLHTQQLQTW